MFLNFCIIVIICVVLVFVLGVILYMCFCEFCLLGIEIKKLFVIFCFNWFLISWCERLMWFVSLVDERGFWVWIVSIREIWFVGRLILSVLNIFWFWVVISLLVCKSIVLNWGFLIINRYFVIFF